jgi:hypothetical protein
MSALQGLKEVSCRLKLAARSRLTRLQQLVGDVRERAHHHHGLASQPLPDNLGGAANGGGVFNGGAAKLQDDGLLGGLARASCWFSDCFTHRNVSCSQLCGKNEKTHRHSPSGGGSVYLLNFSS